MTPTPEERAEKVADDMRDHVGQYPEWLSIVALISQAIREAEDAAYERAAALAKEYSAACEANAVFWEVHQKPERQGCFEAMASEVEDVSEAILALKSPKEV